MGLIAGLLTNNRTGRAAAQRANFAAGPSNPDPYGREQVSALSNYDENNFQTLNPKILSSNNQKDLAEYRIDKKNRHGFSNQALLSADKKTLFLSLDGQTLVDQHLQKPSFLKWLLSLIGLTKAHDPKKQALLNLYRKTYNPKFNTKLDVKAEPEEHFIKSLEKNHYYGQLIFRRDSANADFNFSQPEFCTITDSLYYASKKLGLKLSSAERQKLKHAFTLDKILAEPKPGNYLPRMMNTAILGITETIPPLSLLTVPFAVNYDDENYSSRVLQNWQHPLLKSKEGWQQETGAMTIIRPRAEQNLPLTNIFGGKLAELEAHTRSYAGSDPLEHNAKHKQVMETCLEANQQILAS